MNDVKIFVCTTFRDFKGSENDEIQRLFLKSIEQQSYNNIELVVTLFGERRVQEEVEKYTFDSAFFNGNVENHRYSLTQVILNAMKHAKEQKNKYIVLWTTCDVIYDNDFFDVIIKNYKQNIIGTSHPHMAFSSINNYIKKIDNKKGKLFSGFDLIYLDNVFLENIKVKKSIEDYIFNDWGVFEHFLISLNEFDTNRNMINIYEESKIYKIENDRVLTNEPNSFLANSHKLNSIVFNRFLTTEKITNKYFDLAYCHIKFKITKNFIGHYLNFSLDVFYLIYRTLRRNIIKIIPTKIKKLVKGMIK